MQLSKIENRTSPLALILLGAALLPWLACSAEEHGSRRPLPLRRRRQGRCPPPAASVPASDSGFTVSGPLIVEHQLDVLYSLMA